MFDTKEQLMEAIMKALPYPEQITGIDFSSDPSAISLTWRTVRLRADLNGNTSEIDGSLQIGSNLSMLFKELLKRTRYPK